MSPVLTIDNVLTILIHSCAAPQSDQQKIYVKKYFFIAKKKKYFVNQGTNTYFVSQEKNILSNREKYFVGQEKIFHLLSGSASVMQPFRDTPL